MMKVKTGQQPAVMAVGKAKLTRGSSNFRQFKKNQGETFQILTQTMRGYVQTDEYYYAKCRSRAQLFPSGHAFMLLIFN